ncbi:unnamed protein product, partial [Ranitomeya imitator]
VHLAEVEERCSAESQWCNNLQDISLCICQEVEERCSAERWRSDALQRGQRCNNLQDISLCICQEVEERWLCREVRGGGAMLCREVSGVIICRIYHYVSVRRWRSDALQRGQWCNNLQDISLCICQEVEERCFCR